MKTLLIAVAFLALSALPAAAAQGPYAGASLGFFIPHDSDASASADVEYDLGGGLNLKGGFKFDDFRVEGEFGYKAADVDRRAADITILSYMINGYYDVNVNSPLKPFLGVGIGLINGDVDGFGDDTVFGYQFTAGASYPLDKNWNLDFYYRLQGSSDFEQAGNDLSYTSSNFNAGFRYNF